MREDSGDVLYARMDAGNKQRRAQYPNGSSQAAAGDAWASM